MAEHLELELELGSAFADLRIDDPARAADPLHGADGAGRGLLTLKYDLGHAGVALRLGRAERLAPDLLAFPERFFFDADGADLTVFGLARLPNHWRAHWGFGGYGLFYGGLLGEVEGDEAFVTGGQITLDLSHAPSGWRFVGRGGPMLGFAAVEAETLAEGLELARSRGLRAVGVPTYVAHVGMLRTAEHGFVFELWLDAFGSYALTPEPRLATPIAGQAQGRNAPAALDGNVRIGWRFGLATLWLGASNLMNEGTALVRPAPDRLAPRQARTFFALLDLQP